MDSESVDAMPAGAAPHGTRSDIASNRRFYDALWSASYVVSPQRFNTWPLLSALAASATARLEIGPGLHPRLPIAGTHFVDVSRPALSRLKARAGLTTLGEITALPFPDCSFDLVCAFDIVEHVEDDRQAFRELSRIARDGAAVIFSVPLRSRALERLRRPRRSRSTLRSRRPPGPPGRALLRARAERGLRHGAPESLAPRLRRVGPDAAAGAGDALVQPALSAPRTALAGAPRMRAGPDRRGEGGRAPARLPAWRATGACVRCRSSEGCSFADCRPREPCAPRRTRFAAARPHDEPGPRLFLASTSGLAALALHAARARRAGSWP